MKPKTQVRPGENKLTPKKTTPQASTADMIEYEKIAQLKNDLAFKGGKETYPEQANVNTLNGQSIVIPKKSVPEQLGMKDRKNILSESDESLSSSEESGK